MDPKTAIKEAQAIFEQMDNDPQMAFAVIAIAKAVDSDPQKVLALLSIAKFLKGA